MEEKIRIVVNSIVSNYEKKFEEIISSCDSQIEKLLFLHIIDQIINYGPPCRPPDEFLAGEPIFDFDTEIKFLNDELIWEYEILDNNSKKEWDIKHRKFKYPSNDWGAHSRIMGVEFSSKQSFSSTSINTSDEYFFRTFQIIPQYFVTDSNYYFIDIAITTKLKYIKSGKELDEIKLAIECDGHEFHSSPEQIEKDNIRARALAKKGWKIIRYSGREINRLDIHKAREIVTEIFDILSKCNK